MRGLAPSPEAMKIIVERQAEQAELEDEVRFVDEGKDPVISNGNEDLTRAISEDDKISYRYAYFEYMHALLLRTADRVRHLSPDTYENYTTIAKCQEEDMLKAAQGESYQFFMAIPITVESGKQAEDVLKDLNINDEDINTEEDTNSMNDYMG